MAYPGRPTLKVLPQFAGTNVVKSTPEQRPALLAFVAEQYQAGRSLRKLAVLTGRTQTAVRRALDQAGVPRRSRGAYRATNEPSS
ncbi:helix-turn-helix domain-containing protein [Puerhibacterium sp. TATVAM-FAB25]|uniref:helix-turn-helix domain-containing protein n=1 Tax=Puerhibacterium sp. TATVAM-FAB25 TaxID=3093699 RepID=UPI00397BE717